MTKEIEYQSQLVKSFKAAKNGYGLKLSHRFLVGIPDLFLAWAGECFFLEAKTQPWPTRNSMISFGVTKIQLHSMESLSKAGVTVRMGLFVRPPRAQPRLYLAVPAEFHSAPLDGPDWIIRGPTENDWPVERIMRCI